MNILSIQSMVACGHVGNAAATLPLQRLGHEVWPVDTVMFSNHPAHGCHRGRIVAPEDVAEIIDGIGELGMFPDCDAVLSGYLGAAGTGQVALDAVAAVKGASRHAVYACDPVMGDAERGFFVGDGIPEFFRERALPRADILIPNGFELGYLSGMPVATPEEARAAAEAVRRQGPDLVVVKGIRARGMIAALCVSDAGSWIVRTPFIGPDSERPAHTAPAAFGAGDAFSALFLGHYLRSREPADALARAMSAIHAVIAATAESRTREIALVAAQDAVTAPPRLFEAKPLD